MSPVVVWAFTDGKAGHENQTRGLLAALAQRYPLDARWISVPAYASVLSLAPLTQAGEGNRSPRGQ